MSFILWSMGLVLALTVGGLAWTAAFYGVCGIIVLMMRHPKFFLGSAGVALAMIAAFATWATIYNINSNRESIRAYEIQHGAKP